MLHDNPIRYYRLGETSGTTAVDSGSQAQNGTINGTVTPVAGLIVSDPNGAFSFDGSTGYISLPTTGLPTGSQSVSLECWIRYSSSSGFPMPVSLGTRINGELTDMYLNPSFELHAEYVALADVNGGVLAANTPYHAVTTYDGTTLSIYINGQLIDHTPVTGNITYGGAAIGAQANPLGGYWPGIVDEVAIYSTVLSANQINHHYVVGTRQSFVGNQGSRRGDLYRR